MIMSTYQKAVLVSELQEMKRLKQSPHNYKFSHRWVYRPKDVINAGFSSCPLSYSVSHTVSSPARAALQSPKAGLKSWLPACLSLSTCTHLSQQTNLSWPSAGSPHKTFCNLGFSHLSFDKFNLSKSAVTWKPARSTVNKSYGHVGLDWPHRAVAGSHTSLLGNTSAGPCATPLFQVCIYSSAVKFQELTSVTAEVLENLSIAQTMNYLE